MLLKKRIPMKYVLGKIKIQLVLLIAYAILFEIFHHYYTTIPVGIPIAVPGIIGTIISFLLAFKSNQAYDRWWEARIIWGSIVNESRTLIRQILTFYKDQGYVAEGDEFKEKFAKRQIAWCYSLRNSLRKEDPIKSIVTFLNEEELAFVKKYQHVPNAILMLHAKDIRKASDEEKINIFQQVEIDNTLTRLCDAMGKCERIKNTIFPTTYSMYIRFTLFLFILLLPLGLNSLESWLAIPIIVTIGAAFFLVEKMAIQLQDPFENRPTDTPITAICNVIENNLIQMIYEGSSEFDNMNQANSKKELSKIDNNPYYIL